MHRKFLIDFADTNNVRRKITISADNPGQAKWYFLCRYPKYIIMDIDEYTGGEDDHPEMEVPEEWNCKDTDEE